MLIIVSAVDLLSGGGRGEDEERPAGPDDEPMERFVPEETPPRRRCSNRARESMHISGA